MASKKEDDKKTRGPLLYTLLDGYALEAVEDVAMADLVKEDGEELIWAALDKRFPQRERSDEMSESLTAAFRLQATDGEDLAKWCSRAKEVFEQ